MSEIDQRIEQAIALTRVVRPPRQHLATFGVTNVHYYLVTEPSYKELVPGQQESVIREGVVVSQRPAIVTPTYMLNLEGFGEHARRYMESQVRRLGPNSPGVLYSYKNEHRNLDIVSGQVPAVAQRISQELDNRSENTAAVILGADDLWDVSLLKFIYDYTAASLGVNVSEMQAMGLFDQHPELDVPRGVVQHIEEMFRKVEEGLDPTELKRELDRWGVFRQYEARFLGMFRKKRT